MNNLTQTTPYVSVIVPVFNDGTRVSICIKKLLAQTYPKICYEIIIVDNGSTDNTADIIKLFPVKYLYENSIQSSYAARNKGILNAQGDIFAFTDSDCLPDENWLKEGVQKLILYNAHLAGGTVHFSYSQKPTGAEVWDSISNMQIEQNIRERGVAKTANLFVRAEVFKQIGYFPNNVKSGGDVAFTKKATLAGCKLVFAPEAPIIHPARKLGALLKKQLRVGIGQVNIDKHNKTKKIIYLHKLIHNFIPPSVKNLKNKLTAKSIHVNKVILLRVWTASYLAKITTGAGNITALLKRRMP